jgi:adenine-specific DNA methylase
MPRWCDLFNPRQLLTHLTYLEKFQQAKERLFADAKEGSEEWEFAAAVATYGAMVFDTSVNYNCVLSRWHFRRTLISPMMELQAFPFKWSYAEWDHSQMLWPWALSKSLTHEGNSEAASEKRRKQQFTVEHQQTLPKDKSVPCIVVDPPTLKSHVRRSQRFFTLAQTL